MTSIMSHGFPVAAYLPAIRKTEWYNKTNILFEDNYEKVFKPLGLKRYELIVVVPHMLRSDPLVGRENLEYFNINEK